MVILKRYVTLLVLIWLYIAWTDGISDSLIAAGAGVAVTWWIYRVFVKVVHHA